MTVTATQTKTSACDFARVKIGQNDEFVMDFSGPHSFGNESPNGLRGVLVRVSVDNGIGVTGAIALGNSNTFEDYKVAASATTTEFYLEDPLPADQAAANSGVFWCRNQSDNNEVKAVKTYDSATKKITLFEGFQRTPLPTDQLYFDHAENIDPPIKTGYGSTTTRLVLNDAGHQHVFVGYDISLVTGSGNTFSRQTRKVTAITETRVDRNETNYNLASVNTATNHVTVAASNYHLFEVASTTFRVVNTGGYSGWSVGDFVQFWVTDGATRTGRIYKPDGTAINFDGNGNASNIQLRLTDHGYTYTLNSALSTAPGHDQTVLVVSGANWGGTHPVVQTSTAATTTVIPLVTIDSALADSHDVIIGDDGIVRDLQSVSVSNKTITLATALSAAPAPGTDVRIAIPSGDFHNESALSIATGASPSTKTLHIEYPFTGLRFTAVGGASNTFITVEMSGVNLPDVQERI